MTALCIIAALLLAVTILFAVHAKAHISFCYRESDGACAEGELRYMFLHLRLFPTEKKPTEEKAKKPKKAKEEETEKFSIPDAFELFTEIYDDLKRALGRLLDYLLRHAVTIYSLNIGAEIGLDEAMKTGMCIGAANGAVYGIIAAMQREMKLKDYNVSIAGNFEGKCLSLGVDCVIGTNIWHIFGLLFAIAGPVLKIISEWRSKNNGKSRN